MLAFDAKRALSCQPTELGGRPTEVPTAGKHQPLAMGEKAVPDKLCGPNRLPSSIEFTSTITRW